MIQIISSVEWRLRVSRRIFLMILNAEIVEQPLRRRLHPHHRSVLPANRKKDEITTLTRNQGRLNQQNLPTTDIGKSSENGVTRHILSLTEAVVFKLLGEGAVVGTG